MPASNQEARAEKRSSNTMTSIVLQVVLCLLAIGCVRQATGWGVAQAAQLGMARADTNELGGHLEERNLLEKRFIWGPSDTSLNDDVASIDATSNSDRRRNGRKTRNNKSDDDDDYNNSRANNDDNDADSDEDDNNNNNDSDGIQTRLNGQQASTTGSGLEAEQLVAPPPPPPPTTTTLANTTSAGAGAPGRVAEPVSASKKTDDSQRPRLFKMGLLIG